MMRLILELHLFVSDLSNIFAELDNSFQILEEYFNFFAIDNVMATDMIHF